MRRTIISVGALLLAVTPASAQRLQLNSASVEHPGAFADVCVALNTEGREVAGVQNDLVWDGACATLEDGSCGIAPGVAKQFHGRIQSGPAFRYRALVLSLHDVDPIDDGPLYCCAFRVDAGRGSCCSVSIVDPGFSDSRGNALRGSAGATARLCVAGGPDSGTPLASTPTPTPSPTVPRADDLASAAGRDGCQTAGGSTWSAWPMVAAALLLIRRRR